MAGDSRSKYLTRPQEVLFRENPLWLLDWDGTWHVGVPGVRVNGSLGTFDLAMSVCGQLPVRGKRRLPHKSWAGQAGRQPWGSESECFVMSGPRCERCLAMI